MGTEIGGEAAIGCARNSGLGLRNGLGAARVGDGLDGLGIGYGVNLHFEAPSSVRYV